VRKMWERCVFLPSVRTAKKALRLFRRCGKKPLVHA